MDSSLLPYRYKNCTFHFPTLTQNQYKHQPPGMLVKLLRLNVPCSSAGYVRFNDTIQLCGKLEELSESQRTFYFHSFSNTSFSIFNYPKFYFIYKLVDYCYNVTLLDRNSSFVIQPTNHLALKCHFKVHLPYGNDIKLSLKLRLNGNADESANVPNIIREIHMSERDSNERSALLDYNKNKIDDEFIELENYSPNSDDPLTFVNHASIDCEWILIEIVNRMNERWSECLKVADRQTNVEYKLASSDNVLLIRITKKQQTSSQASSYTSSTTENNNPQINLEYAAVPIDTIVSQCAFGWILVGQFCMAPFDELVSWQKAATRCNELGGHLASITSDNDQHYIDLMLINR